MSEKPSTPRGSGFHCESDVIKEGRCPTQCEDCSFREATKRGKKDGANYLQRYRAGEHGLYIKDRYPSNPYHESDNRHPEYNKGFNDGCEHQIYIG